MTMLGYKKIVHVWSFHCGIASGRAPSSTLSSNSPPTPHSTNSLSWIETCASLGELSGLFITSAEFRFCEWPNSQHTRRRHIYLFGVYIVCFLERKTPREDSQQKLAQIPHRWCNHSGFVAPASVFLTPFRILGNTASRNWPFWSSMWSQSPCG